MYIPLIQYILLPILIEMFKKNTILFQETVYTYNEIIKKMKLGVIDMIQKEELNENGKIIGINKIGYNEGIMEFLFLENFII